MVIHQLNTSYSHFNARVRFNKIESKIRKLEAKMGVQKSVQLNIDKFSESPHASHANNMVVLPSWFLFKYEDIPSQFRLDSLNDRRLVDRRFLTELAGWMNEKFREAGLSSVIHPADYGILQTVIMRMRDRDLYHKSRNFTLCHELAHLNHHQTAERALFWESISIAGIIGGISLLFVAVAVIPLVHLAVTLTMGGIAVTISTTGVLAWLNKPNSPAAASPVEEEKNADMDAVEALQEARGGIHTFETHRLFNLAVRRGDPSTQCKIDLNGNYLEDTKHPPLTERIAYLRQWQSQHLQRV